MSEKVGSVKGTQLDEEFVDLEKVSFHSNIKYEFFKQLGNGC